MNEASEPKISAKPRRRPIRLAFILGVGLGMFAEPVWNFVCEA